MIKIDWQKFLYHYQMLGFYGWVDTTKDVSEYYVQVGFQWRLMLSGIITKVRQ